MTQSTRILCFGDSITKAYAACLEGRMTTKLCQNSTVFNRGVAGSTTEDALSKLSESMELVPDIVIVGFGMNDQGIGEMEGKRVSPGQFAKNLRTMIEEFEESGARVFLLTFNPVYGSVSCKANRSAEKYNTVIRKVARESCVRIVDVHRAWKERFDPYSKGLCDGCHPNAEGVNLYCEKILEVLQRKSQIILWQYNGNPCACNYHCPYCQYEEQKGHFFQGPIGRWHEAFKNSFGNQHLVFYFGHGEPMVGKAWFDVVNMIGDEPNWEMRCISNLSVSLNRLLFSRVAREGRLNINASFHPTETSIECFLKKLWQCRDAGIEAPVVYTMYPPFFERFHEDVMKFTEHKFLVHVRRFRGEYEGKMYPEAYTHSEINELARYCDDITIKYMLSDEPTDGKPSWTGTDFCLVDKDGNVGYCDDYPTNRFAFGNVFEGNVALNQRPEPFPRAHVSDGTVDGVANICEIGYPQLEGNHILHFSQMGGVYRTGKGVHYKNLYTDFTNSWIRAQFRMPARNWKDAWCVWRASAGSFLSRVERLGHALYPQRFNYRRDFSLHDLGKALGMTLRRRFLSQSDR